MSCHAAKRLIAGIVFVSMALFCHAASAADVTRDEPLGKTTHNWSGAYVGIQVGGALTGDTTISSGGTSATEELDGILAGILYGYNFQRGNLVFGIDSDASFSTIDEPFNVVRIKSLSTTRLRVGYAYNNLLPYVTAGAAYGLTEIDAGGIDDTEFSLGWTAGAGLEIAATNNISARLQYNYVDLGEDTFSTAIGRVNLGNDDIHIVRAGVSIKTRAIIDAIFKR